MRANIILSCADGMTGNAIAQKLATRPNTVSKWINRWIEIFTPAQLASSQSKTEEEQEEQLELKAVLGDSPRPGTPPTFDVEACVEVRLHQHMKYGKNAWYWSEYFSTPTSIISTMPFL
ncbi:MAG: helix-turn-helix domain-containing protein [Verrucomicrobiales bacterium]